MTSEADNLMSYHGADGKKILRGPLASHGPKWPEMTGKWPNPSQIRPPINLQGQSTTSQATSQPAPRVVFKKIRESSDDLSLKFPDLRAPMRTKPRRACPKCFLKPQNVSNVLKRFLKPKPTSPGLPSIATALTQLCNAKEPFFVKNHHERESRPESPAGTENLHVRGWWTGSTETETATWVSGM